MITLNTLDQATYETLRLSLLKKFEEKKDANGDPILSKTVYFDGGADGVGNPTIGIGMNLRDDTVGEFFAEWVLERYGAASEENIRLVSAQIKLAVSEGSSFNTAASLQTKLNLIVAEKTGNPSATCDLLTDQEVEDAFVGLAKGVYEPKIDTWYGSAIEKSYERLALLSLSYNGGLGPNLRTAIQEGDRPEAWYEIRYQTNKNALPGLAKRRYFESQIFGLYDNPNSVTESEAKSIFKTYTSHRSTIESYDAKYSSQIASANSDYGTDIVTVQSLSDATKTAHDLLSSSYAPGKEIGEILVGSDINNSLEEGDKVAGISSS